MTAYNQRADVAEAEASRDAAGQPAPWEIDPPIQDLKKETGHECSLCQQQEGILIYQYLFAPPFLMSCYLRGTAYVAKLSSAYLL